MFHIGGALNEQNGAGWVLTLIEAMRAEWHCSLHQAVFAESLNAALVLWPALLSRHGAEVQFSHTDKARQTAKDKARAWFEANYEIAS